MQKQPSKGFFKEGVTRFFWKQHFFSTQPQCCLTFSWIELQMLLRYCLIYISIIILRHFLYLLYLCPSLDQGLFISYLCYLFFIFIFVMVNRMNADTLVLLLIFQNMSYYFYMKNKNLFQISKGQPKNVA